MTQKIKSNYYFCLFKVCINRKINNTASESYYFQIDYSLEKEIPEKLNQIVKQIESEIDKKYINCTKYMIILTKLN